MRLDSLQLYSWVETQGEIDTSNIKCIFKNVINIHKASHRQYSIVKN